jgi:cytochrome P450
MIVFKISSVLNDPDLFQNPEKFQPERFLQADGTTLRKDMIEYAIPFSMGKRQCAGEL